MCFDESKEFHCQRTALSRARFIETHRVRAEHARRIATLGVT
jgi:hypothetical protein